MDNNLIQFAPIFDAVGAKINFDTNTLEAEVVEYPQGKKRLVQAALAEIDKFIDTRVYNDGIAIFAVASYVDGNENPIHQLARISMLEELGLLKEGRYISQVLALMKTNKSWHTSEEPNTCTHFGDLCTHRGITEVDGKRGRKSTRPPDEYHIRKSNGTINREQLITPSLEAMYRAIPAESLISVTGKSKTVIRLDKIGELEPEELQMILDKIKMIEEARNATV